MPDQQLLAGSVTYNQGISKFSLALEGGDVSQITHYCLEEACHSASTVKLHL